MSHESNYVQWARDAEADGEHARAAEFWRRAHDESPKVEYITQLMECERKARACMCSPAKVRTGRRTIRGEHGRGIIVMEFSPPNLVTFRLKGKRKRFPTTLPALYDFALRVEARRLQDERTKARKARRLNKGKA